MRKLLWLIVISALLWSGWWFAATLGMQRAVSAWFEARKAEGWQAEVSDIQQRGFPFALHTKVVAPQLADPETGVAIEMDHIDFEAPAYWPGYMTVTLPETPILLASPLNRSHLTMDAPRAELNLHPGTMLELQSMLASAGAWQLDADQGSLLSGDALHMSVAQEEATPDSYKIDLVAIGVSPGDLSRGILRLPSDWPRAFETFSANMTVLFDRPWDRTALNTRRPQPVVISLHRAEAVWGALRILAVGDISVSPLGVPDGSFTLKAENWRSMLDLAQASGSLGPAFRFQIEALLGALANQTGSTTDLDVTITFRNGQAALGPIPLGPAPRIVLR